MSTVGIWLANGTLPLDLLICAGGKGASLT